MFNSIRVIFITTLVSTIALADVFMTELTDPQNSSDAGRYVELYNNGNASVDLAEFTVQRWTNGNVDPTASSVVALTGTISAGGFYIICNDADKYAATFGLTCDQDIGTGGFADSNGDDNMALVRADGTIVDIFGVPGEDGTGTGHEFEDGRAERAVGNITASDVWDATGWNIDNDSGGGDGNQYAPEGFDPGAWIGAEPASDTCEDTYACNVGDEGDCDYPASGYDCDGNCVADLDCAGICNGDAVVDDCGECGGDGSACAEPAANLFFSEHAEGSSNNKYFEVYNASDSDVSLDGYAFVNCSNGCTEWEYTNDFAEGAVVTAGGTYTVCHSFRCRWNYSFL
jgi:predicted extracellular nuclease